MKKKKLLALTIAATLLMGGFPQNMSVEAATKKVTVLTSPVEAVKAIRSYDEVHLFKKVDEKQKRKENIESRILLRVSEEPKETLGAAEVFYYTVGDYYILKYNSKEDADNAEKKLIKIYGDDRVIRDRVIMQDEVVQAQDDGEEEVVAFDGIHAMGMDSLKEEAKDWSGNVEVAVIDSGVDRDHELLQGRIDTTKSINLAEGESSAKYDDNYGHGSHVSGIITQATPSRVKIMAVRVFDDYQMSSLTVITMGIDYARENHADIMNMSLGHTSPTDKELDFINDTMEKSVEEGATLFAASGNEDNNVSTSCPANNSWTISVGSLSLDEANPNQYVRSWFSNYGKRLDFTAPGNNISSAWADGSIQIVSGTSMATPHMAAAAAMVKLKHPSYNQWEIYSTLQDYTVDLGEPGKDELYGNGYVNLKDFAKEQEASEANPKYQSISANAVTKKTMNDVGKSFSLDAKLLKGDGNLSYSSSDQSIATVSSDGKITVRGTGKCEITITASKTAKYKETKRTVQVEITKGSQEIVIPTINYTKSLGDKGFSIKASVKVPGDGKISFIANDNPVLDITKDGYVTLKGIGTTQVYAVASGTKSFNIKYSNPITVTVKLAAPSSLKATAIAYNKATLSWKKVTGATGYEVYQYNTKTKRYSKITAVKGTSYTKSELTVGTSYQFKVRAVTGKNQYSDYTKAVSVKTFLAKVTSLTAKNNKKGSVKLSWKKVDGASGYKVYQYNTKTKKYVKVATVKNTTYTKTKLKAKASYKFKVRAYKTVGKKTVYGNYSSVKSVKVAK